VISTGLSNTCGETVSNLVRKEMICEATYMKCFGGSKEYECEISVPDGVSGEEEDSIVQNAINKIRRILGMEEIEL